MIVIAPVGSSSSKAMGTEMSHEKEIPSQKLAMAQ
jgi:hypothetical protein